MDTTQRGITTLIRSSLAQRGFELPAGFDMEEAYPHILRHGIVTMAYDGALLCGVDKKLPAMQKLFQGYLKSLLHSEGQMKMLDRLCKALDEKGFDHLLMKGSIMKALYPKPELRLMGDADILIRKEQYAEICPLMENLGFKNTAEGFYDYGWKSPELYVELHHCLSNPYNTDFNDYLGDGWPRAVRCTQESSRFEYSPEDHFIYLFIHFTKHYRDGGIGLRHAVDLWVSRCDLPADSEEYLLGELCKMDLHIFYGNVMRMLSAWFADGEEDDVTAFLGRSVYLSTAFGGGEQSRKAVALRAANKTGSSESARFWCLLRVVFPNCDTMQRRYPILKKHPWLHTLMWPVRWIDVLLFRRKNIKKQLSYARESTGETIESYRQALSYVGLNYTIKD